MIEFACKHCHALIRLSIEKVGSSGFCPRCGKPITVPTGSAVILHDDAFVESNPQLVKLFQTGVNGESVDLESQAITVAGSVIAWFFGLLFLSFFLASVWHYPLASLPTLAGAALLIPPIFQHARSIVKIELGIQWRLTGAVTLFICYMLIYSSAASNESTERSRLEQKQTEQTRQVEQNMAVQYLKSNKAVIQAEAEKLLVQGRIFEAVNVVRRYQDLGDPEIDAFLAKANFKKKAIAEEAQKARLLASLSSLNEGSISERVRVYEQLATLSPENAEYKKQAVELRAQIGKTTTIPNH